MAAQQLMDSGIPNNKIDIAVRGAADKSAASGAEQFNRPNPTPSDATASKRDNDFFNSLFDNRDESSKYSEVARHGSIVTVHTNSKDEAKRAAEILDKAGAIDVNERAAQYRNMSSSSKGSWTGSGSSKGSSSSIPVVEENLQVGKREVETGGVKLRSRIIERPVEEKLRLREEHVNVERQPVNRPASEADLKNFKEGERTIVEHAEKPMVNKEARVVEEVRLKKDTTEREETVRDTVRKQDVDVDKINPKGEKKGPNNPNNLNKK